MAAMWKPISVDELQNLILDCELEIEDTAIASLWKFIKLSPQKWQNHPMGDEGMGFWVVAIFGRQVIWYNDIEDGFNISTYSIHGIIDEYWCSQLDLKSMLRSLYSSLNVVSAPVV